MSTGVIIGASGGIGAACARALAGDADRLVLSGRRIEALHNLQRELASDIQLAVGDITSAAGREALATAIGSTINWLVLATGMPIRRPLSELTDEEITGAFTTNLVAPTLLLRRLLSLNWDSPAAITVIGSISASRALPRRAVYGASKAGIEHLARSLAAELAQEGIRVNVVTPGVIETPFLGDDRSSLGGWVRERVPVGRLGTPEEVAKTVRFVTIEAPSFLTGARLTIDGGAEVLG